MKICLVCRFVSACGGIICLWCVLATLTVKNLYMQWLIQSKKMRCASRRQLELEMLSLLEETSSSMQLWRKWCFLIVGYFNSSYAFFAVGLRFFRATSFDCQQNFWKICRMDSSRHYCILCGKKYLWIETTQLVPFNSD